MGWQWFWVLFALVGIELQAYYITKALHRIEERLREIAYKQTGSIFDGLPEHAKDDGGDDAVAR